MLFSLLKPIFEVSTFISRSKILKMVHILYLLILHNSLLWVWEHSIVPSSMEGEVDLHEFLFED